MRWYQGKKVFITGGSSGIGKATAKLLAGWGADVVIAARGKERLEAYGEARYGGLDQALAEIREQSPEARCDAISLDITDKAAVAAAVTKVIETLSGLDILINNAGLTHPGYIQEIPDAVFDQMMQVNFFGTVNVTRAFLPHFIAQGSGHICNVSSILGFLGIFGYSAYAASKFAITGFSDCLRQELLPHNVGLSVVFPPDTHTPQHAEEEKILPPETKAVAGHAKALAAEDVAREMLVGIAADRYHICPGFSTKFNYFMYRHFPWMVRWSIDNDVKKFART